jgi:hypothetical protein
MACQKDFLFVDPLCGDNAEVGRPKYGDSAFFD